MARKNLFQKREVINIYVDNTLKADLEEIANTQWEPVSWIVRGLIREYIALCKKKPFSEKGK